MKKRAIKKDFLMEIRKSMGRFLSMFLIVAMGVAFFSGIRAAEPDMKYSGDAYFDRLALMDIQIISNLGLTERDLSALKELDCIEKAEAGYSADVLVEVGDNQKILHVSSILDTLNKYTVEEGRMPQKSGECLMDARFFQANKLNIGDKITLISGTADLITDTFKQQTFEIVGSASSPCYISFNRGSSTIGNGEVNGFMALLPEDFALEVFTECYLTVNGAKELTAFTKNYEQKIQQAIAQIEAIADEQGQKRADELRDEAEEKLKDARQELEEAKKEANEKLANASAQIEDANAQLSEGREKIESAKKEIEDNKKALRQNQQNIDDAFTQIEQGREQLEQGIQQFNDIAPYLQSDEQGMAQMEEMRRQLEASEQELLLAEAQALEGQSQIDSGWKAIEEGEAEINRNEAKIAESQQELDEAQAEYEKNKQEAEQSIKDGEKEIRDAQKDINKIENAVWYVNDRTVNSDYAGYGDNANRMRAIGKVFPILFFIVAALISLTTMTRMVEEQRTQIGTLKALGYNKFSIAGKYLNYALLASVSGSIAGVAFGEKAFPYVIVTAYKIIYASMPDIVIPYEWTYATMATGAAVLCTGLAALLSCYHELACQPAVLMRPPTPKQGKRVLLERVPFIWRRLGFIWKATIRNLVRYKKRFFMTVFGIGGCMSLIILGFGLRDSILTIGDIQYKEIQTYDGMIILDSDAAQEDLDELKKWLQTEEKIADFSETYVKKITVQSEEEEKEVYLYVPLDLEKNKVFFHFRDRTSHQSYELQNDSLFLTEKAAGLLDVKAGEEIAIENGKETAMSLTVTQICENYMDHYLFFSPQTYEKIYGETVKENAIYFLAQDSDEKTLQEIGSKILEHEAALNVSYTYNVEEQLNHILGSLDIVIAVLILSAGLLSFVVLYNLNTINITERKRELATVKVLGFYDSETSAYIYRENILLTLIGTAAGIVMGIVLHRYVIVTVEIDNVMFTRIIAPVSFLISMLLTFAFSILVNVAMHFKIKKINMVESLKSVE